MNILSIQRKEIHLGRNREKSPYGVAGLELSLKCTGQDINLWARAESPGGDTCLGKDFNKGGGGVSGRHGEKERKLLGLAWSMVRLLIFHLHELWPKKFLLLGSVDKSHVFRTARK